MQQKTKKGGIDMNAGSVIEKRGRDELFLKIERKIPRIAKEVYDEKKQKGDISFSGIKVNDYSAGFHAVVVSSVIATDAFSSYSENDGDVIAYIRWFLSSAMDIINKEFNKGIIKEGDILNNPMNFYKKIANEWYLYNDLNIVSERLGITKNTDLLDKAIGIYEERIV